MKSMFKLTLALLLVAPLAKGMESAVSVAPVAPIVVEAVAPVLSPVVTQAVQEVGAAIVQGGLISLTWQGIKNLAFKAKEVATPVVASGLVKAKASYEAAKVAAAPVVASALAKTKAGYEVAKNAVVPAAMTALAKTQVGLALAQNAVKTFVRNNKFAVGLAAGMVVAAGGSYAVYRYFARRAEKNYLEQAEKKHLEQIAELKKRFGTGCIPSWSQGDSLYDGPWYDASI